MNEVVYIWNREYSIDMIVDFGDWERENIKMCCEKNNEYSC